MGSTCKDGGKNIYFTLTVYNLQQKNVTQTMNRTKVFSREERYL